MVLNDKPEKLDEILSFLHHQVYVAKNFDNAITTIESLGAIASNNSYILRLKAFLYLENKQYSKASDCFKNLHEKYHEGFCYLLSGDEQAAKEIWERSPQSSSIVWGLALLHMIHGKMDLKPSFLQIRNFLEHDLHYLLSSRLELYVHNLVQLADELSNINLESYKYLGRAFLAHQFNTIAAKYLESALNILPDDPEVYFLIAQYYLQEECPEESIKFLKQCLQISPGYKPAELLLTMVQ